MNSKTWLLAVSIFGFGLAACGDDDEGSSSFNIGFESVALGSEGTLIGADSTPAVEIEGALFYSFYDAEFDVSSGFSVSSLTDTTTPGFMNALSAFPGSGAGGSAQFAVWNPPFGSEDPAIEFPMDMTPSSVQVANTTYAALSMQMGDQFAKQHTAEDQDFFKVTFTGVREDGTNAGSVEHYLSDFRTGDVPGIQSDWVRVSLSALGTVRSIAISFDSSDVGSFGINTPLYVAIDDLKYE